VVNKIYFVFLLNLAQIAADNLFREPSKAVLIKKEI